jgi:hypothetical protein
VKRYLVPILALLLSLTAGCASHLPKPVNANGSVNVSVATGEAAIKFAEAVDFAQGYIATCHANMATVGCSEAKITQVKAAILKGQTAIHAAANAIKANPNIGQSSLDGYLADLNAAILILQTLAPNGG